MLGPLFVLLLRLLDLLVALGHLLLGFLLFLPLCLLVALFLSRFLLLVARLHFLSDLNLVAVEESVSLELCDNLSHRVLVLAGFHTGSQELKTFLDLAFEAFAKLGGRGDAEAVDTGGDRALVSEVAGDLTLVLEASAADERGVEDETVLGRLAFGLEGSEEGLLSTQDLDGRGGVLRKVGQAAGVCNKLRAHNFTDERLQVGGYSVHSVFEVLGE